MSVSIQCRLKSVSVRRGTLRRVTGRLLRLLDEAGAEVCIGLVGDTKMRRLNRTYRHQDRTTDVLAFAYREAQPDVSSLLGDVVISVPTARRQAQALSHSLDEEVLRLLIHGILHLVGYDHERSRQQARRMHRKETELFETFTPVPSLVVACSLSPHRLAGGLGRHIGRPLQPTPPQGGSDNEGENRQRMSTYRRGSRNSWAGLIG